jgi:hypothetical protein
VEWKTIFNKIRVIKELKLNWLQLRIVHRIFGNLVTAGMGLENKDRCTCCNMKKKENIQLFFLNKKKLT